jgi:hypothetical protein
MSERHQNHLETRSVNFKIKGNDLGSTVQATDWKNCTSSILIQDHECKATTLNSIGRPRVSRMESRASKELSLAFALYIAFFPDI